MNLKQRDRERRLLPNNHPRFVRVYDNEGETADRYTVIFTGRYDDIGRKKHEIRRDVRHYYIGMSANPLGPNGFCQMNSDERIIDIDRMSGFPPKIGSKSRLGKRIHWFNLPGECQRAALHAYKELWDLYPDGKRDGQISIPGCESLRSGKTAED